MCREAVPARRGWACWTMLDPACLLLLACACATQDPADGPPGVCLRDDDADRPGGPATWVAITQPADGTVVTNYRGGGRGTTVDIQYEVQHLPCGGSSRIFVEQDGTLVQVDASMTQPQTSPVVRFSIHLTPARYRFGVVVYDRDGRERAREWASCHVELPEYARHVRVLGTHDTLAAILDAIAHNHSGAYLRFGDGDIQLASGSQDQMQALLLPPLSFSFLLPLPLLFPFSFPPRPLFRVLATVTCYST
jgi:hypothetical protein